MQNYKQVLLSRLLIFMLLLFLICNAIAIQCEKCGNITVPYPLSTSPRCGDQLYKVRCSKGTLWLDTLNRSSYRIISISPENQRMIVQPQGFLSNNCMSKDIESGGIWLNDSLPFNITDSNTILKFNCSKKVATLSSMDCSPSSLCHAYLKVVYAENTAWCHTLPYCCSYTTGGSKTAYRIDLSEEGCVAFQSFVNMDDSLPVRKWPEQGVEIQWKMPQEPICKSVSDCVKCKNSRCLSDPGKTGQKRCLCISGFVWDPINGICSAKKCNRRSHCHRQLNRKHLYKGLSLAASGFLLIALFALLIQKFRKHIKEEAHRKLVKQREEILNANSSGKAAKLFSGKEIIKATNKFAKENLLGVGGFGEVFKGILHDKTLAAVKREKLPNSEGMDQVLNEVRVLCQVNHRSLVKLLGCCVELEQAILVYEYVPNGTLFDHLRGRYSNEWGTLTWKRRLIIAQQIADGLNYLHFSATPQIIHRDIKSSNILLDEKLDAKVSDFGLSRLIEADKTHASTCAQGTLGYLDPEYYQNFQLTDKSDVYSFGVVLLELLTSKKAIDLNREDDDVNLVGYVSKFGDIERLMDVVDMEMKKKASDLELETMKAMGLLAIACVDEQRKNRPSMREVSEELEYVINIINNGSIKKVNV